MKNTSALNCATTCTNKSKTFPLALLALLGMLATMGTQAVNITDNHERLDEAFYYLEDEKGELTLDELLANPTQYSFTSSQDSKPSTSFTPVWLKLTLDFNEDLRHQHYYLFGRVGNFFDVRIYRPNKQGVYSEWKTGLNYPASTREISAQRFGFHIEPKATPTTVYIRYVGGAGTSRLPWDLVEKHTYTATSSMLYRYEIGSFSAIGALLCFNLIIAISLRRKNHFYYCLYVASVWLSLMTMAGVGPYYLWPEMPSFNDNALHFFTILAASFRLLAIVSFLDMANNAPRWNFATVSVFSLLGAAFIGNGLWGVTQLPPNIAIYACAIGILYGFAVCIQAIRLRVKLAWPLFLSLLAPAVAGLIEGVIAFKGGPTTAIDFQAAEIGLVIHVLLFSFCLAAQMKTQAESHMVALHDSLTGLPRKRLLEERFEWAANLSKRQQWKMAMLYIDLDGFKNINDSLGHTAGDQLLVQASARMQGVLRETDFVARVGGDEFVILLLELKEDYSIVPVVEKLLEAVAKPYRVEGKEARISASIGVALCSGHGEDLESLTKAADGAMYVAKGNGKNNYSVADIRYRANPTSSTKPLTEASTKSGALVKYLT